MLGGCALADAIGFCVEGSPRKVCLEYIEEVVLKSRYELVECGQYGFGQYSDDTQLTRELLSSYVELGRFDPAGFAARLAALFESGRAVGWGRATEQSAKRLIGGVDWRHCGEPPPSAGCGSAVRAGAVGLIFFDHTDALRDAAIEQSIITHQDSRAQAGALCVAFVVAFVLKGGGLSKAELLDEAIGSVEPVSEDFAHALLRLKRWSALEPERALSCMAEQCGIAFRDGLSPYVIPVVLWALYSFLRTPDDYLRAISTALSCGGDVDSTAAITGAISGAYLGEESLPQETIEKINDCGHWRWQELRELALQVWTLKTEGCCNEQLRDDA